MILRLNKLITLILWIALFECIGFYLGLLTQANIQPWYEHLNKPSLTPPGFIFSVVWSILYALLAIIAWILASQDKQSSKPITALFALQMVMNWAWTPLFFGLHWLMLSGIWLISLTGLNLLLIFKAKKTHSAIFWLLIPYILWLMFAFYLNAYIALMN